MGYDLSKVMFIATSNSLSSIQPALRDRMEVINVSGYTIEEKIEIAKQHLLPKQLKEHGLTPKELQIGKKQIEKIVVAICTVNPACAVWKNKLRLLVRNAAKSIALEEDLQCKSNR